MVGGGRGEGWGGGVLSPERSLTNSWKFSGVEVEVEVVDEEEEMEEEREGRMVGGGGGGGEV